MTSTTVETVGLTPRRISWGAIFAATAVSVGVWILLYVFGLAVGLTTLSPMEAGSWRSTGIGTGVWSVIAPLVALFVGGLIASRESAVLRRLDAAIHGVVLWGVTAVIGVVAIGLVISSLVGGALTAAGATLQTATEAGASVAGAPEGQAQQQEGQGALEMLGLSANDLLAPINQELREQGRPEVSAAGLQAALQDVVNNAVRTGTLNRGDILSALAANTALSRADAEAVATRLEQQWQTQSGQLIERVRTQAATAADAAADAVAGAMWAIFIALLLSLIAAVGGALLGIGRVGGPRRRQAYEGEGQLAPAH